MAARQVTIPSQVVLTGDLVDTVRPGDELRLDWNGFGSEISWIMSTPDETKPWIFAMVYELGGYSSNSHFI